MDQVTAGSSMSPMFAAFKADSKVSFIRPYDPKQSVAVEGYRHAVVRFRDTTKGVSVKPAQMVTVPSLLFPDDWKLPAQAGKVLLGVFEDQQDEMIRGEILKESKLINWPDISLEKVLDSLTAIQTSQRLNKDQIEAWVMASMVPFLTQRGIQISEAKGFPEQSEARNKQVAGVINNYKVKFAALAAPLPNLKQDEAIALKNMLAISKLDDDVAKSLGRKIHAILNPEILEGIEL